jgi:hypothetical protein
MTLPAYGWISKGGVSFDSQFDVSLRDLSKCASVRHWLNHGCQVPCSLPEHYATSAAQHTGTVLCIKQLPAEHHTNLASIPNTGLEGGGGGVDECTQQHEKRETLLKYVATPLKFRLPT